MTAAETALAADAPTIQDTDQMVDDMLESECSEPDDGDSRVLKILKKKYIRGEFCKKRVNITYIKMLPRAQPIKNIVIRYKIKI